MTSIGHDQAADDGPRPETDNAKSLGMATALLAVLIVVNLVSLPGPAKEAIPHCHLEVG
jgi:hypothetical protein